MITILQLVLPPNNTLLVYITENKLNNSLLLYCKCLLIYIFDLLSDTMLSVFKIIL